MDLTNPQHSESPWRKGVMFAKRDTAPLEIVRAIKTYNAQHESELSFNEGDDIVQLDESSGWLEGELNGRKGWFPQDYVVPLASTTSKIAPPRPPRPTADDTELGVQGSSILSSRNFTSERLESFLTLRRPQRKDLENRNILPAGTAVGSSCSPQVVDAQKRLERTKKKQVLSNFLRGRGTLFRKKEVKGSVFGGEIFHTEEQPWEMPAVILSCVNRLETALDTQGLFRISGNQLDINQWKEVLNAHEGLVDFAKENIDVHVVACLLKEFIRSLAEPPVPFALYDQLMECMGMDLPSGAKRSEAVVAALDQGLPQPNKIFLNYMLAFLKEVSMHADVNMMTSANLGIIFGPSFVRPKIETLERMMSPKPVELVGMLIDMGSLATTA